MSKREGPDRATASRCYAAPLGGCGGAISSEHYVSRALLERLGSRIEVKGRSWTAGTQTMSPKALGTKVLCQRHNSLLSPLDNCAASIFGCMRDVYDGRGFQPVTFAGELLERWMIKVLIGLVTSGNARREDGLDSRTFAIPSAWIEMLFGRREIAPPYGLYFFDLVAGQFTSAPLEITLNTEVNPHAIYGIRAELMGLNLHVRLRTPAVLPEEPCFYRPSGFLFEGNEGLILFNWKSSGSGKVIKIGQFYPT